MNNNIFKENCLNSYNNKSDEYYISVKDLKKIINETDKDYEIKYILEKIKPSFIKHISKISNHYENDNNNRTLDNEVSNTDKIDYLNFNISVNSENDKLSFEIPTTNLKRIFSNFSFSKSIVFIKKVLNLLLQMRYSLDENTCLNSKYSTQKDLSNNKELSVSDAINLYCEANNVKNRTKEVYENSFKQVFSYYLNLNSKSLKYMNDKIITWKSFPVNKIELPIFTDFLGCSHNTRFHYLKNINTILKWLTINNYLKNNVLENYIKTIKQKPQSMRPALLCENWLNLREASQKIGNFLAFIKNNKSTYYSWLILLITGTRLQETWRYIQGVYNNENNGNPYIFIETKNTKKGSNPDFRIPITNYLKKLINKLFSLGITNFGKFRYALVHLIKKSEQYKNIICVHGSRAIFRTVIDYLTSNKNIPTEAKEMYLNHSYGTVISRKYQRQDYFNERKKLQYIYSKFIFTCANDDEFIQYF